MRKLFYLMGKSASGKDTLYRMLLSDPSLALCPFVIYTTRPMRDHEREGVEYHFTDESGLKALEEAGKVIERRTYDTVHGPWHYFTVDDGLMDEKAGTDEEEPADLLGIGTPKSFVQVKAYFGKDRVIPLYVDVPPEIIRKRALKREMAQEVPKLEEMERRLAADEIDFAPEKLAEAGIRVFYDNSKAPEETFESMRAAVLKEKAGPV